MWVLCLLTKLTWGSVWRAPVGWLLWRWVASILIGIITWVSLLLHWWILLSIIRILLLLVLAITPLWLCLIWSVAICILTLISTSASSSRWHTRGLTGHLFSLRIYNIIFISFYIIIKFNIYLNYYIKIIIIIFIK